MKTDLQRKPNEPTWKWVYRLARELNFTDEQLEAMKEVNRLSYMDGMNDYKVSLQKKER